MRTFLNNANVRQAPLEVRTMKRSALTAERYNGCCFLLIIYFLMDGLKRHLSPSSETHYLQKERLSY